MSESVLFDHIAIGVPSIAEASHAIVGKLGGLEFEGGPGIGFRWGQWKFFNQGVIELIEPDGPPGGFVHRFLASRGTGVHHVTFKVPELRKAADRAESLGYTIVGYNDQFPEWKEAFLHPKQAQGVVVQLAESKPAAGSWEAPPWSFPPRPANPPDPVAVLGLRLAAASEAEARRQWEETLQGVCEAHDGALRFRWPGSPMRLHIEIDPEVEPGPTALEVASNRQLDTSDNPNPLLGTRILQLEA